MSSVLKYTLEENVPVIIKAGEFRSAVLPAHQEEQQPEISILELQEEIKKNLAYSQDTLKNAGAKAEEILKQAGKEAEDLKQKAYAEGQESGYKEGYKEGFEKGENDIHEQMKKLIEDTAQKAQRLLELTQRQTKEMIIEANDKIVDIVITTVKKALCQEVLANPEAIVEIVKEALEKVSEHEQIIIRVNPEDFDKIIESKHELQKIIGREHDLSITADRTIACGGCTIDTLDGAVDAKLDTKLEILIKTIQDIKKIENGLF